MKPQEQYKIENELGQKIKIIKICDEIVSFHCEDNIDRVSRLTKSGRHKKNSISVFK